MSFPALNAFALCLVMLLSTVLGGPVVSVPSGDTAAWGASAELPLRSASLRSGDLKPFGAERRAAKKATAKKIDDALPAGATPLVLAAWADAGPAPTAQHPLPAPLPAGYLARAPPLPAA